MMRLVDAYEATASRSNWSRTAGWTSRNSFFIRDLMLMTPEGAIITRPASTMRAGRRAVRRRGTRRRWACRS